MTRKTEPVAYETIYGWMEFKSLKKAEEFKAKICSWAGFTAATAPSTIQEAVEFHKTYEHGGIPAVYTLIREKQAELRSAVRLAEAERRTRYHLASLAPRDSIFYKEHFQESYPGYKYGW